MIFFVAPTGMRKLHWKKLGVCFLIKFEKKLET
jgi:hypothetical protein